MRRIKSMPVWQKLLFVIELSFLAIPNTASASQLKYAYKSTITYSPITSMLGESVYITLITDPSLVFPSYNPSSNFASYIVPFSDVSVRIGDFQWDYDLQAGNVRIQNDYVTFGTKQDVAAFSIGSFSPLSAFPSYSYNGVNMTLAMFDASVILRSPNGETVPAFSSNAFPESFSGFDTTNLPGYYQAGGLMLMFMDPQTRLSINVFGDIKSASLQPVPLPPSWILMIVSLFPVTFCKLKSGRVGTFFVPTRI